MHIAQQQMLARALHRRIYAADHFGKEFAKQIRQDHADRVSLLPGQAAGAAVGHIVQLGGRSLYLAAGFRGDNRQAVQRARCRGYRHARRLCNFPDCYHGAPMRCVVIEQGGNSTTIGIRSTAKFIRPRSAPPSKGQIIPARFRGSWMMDRVPARRSPASILHVATDGPPLQPG